MIKPAWETLPVFYLHLRALEDAKRITMLNSYQLDLTAKFFTMSSLLIMQVLA